jgi:hypothetical protein
MTSQSRRGSRSISSIPLIHRNFPFDAERTLALARFLRCEAGSSLPVDGNFERHEP